HLVARRASLDGILDQVEQGLLHLRGITDHHRLAGHCGLQHHLSIVGHSFTEQHHVVDHRRHRGGVRWSSLSGRLKLRNASSTVRMRPISPSITPRRSCSLVPGPVPLAASWARAWMEVSGFLSSWAMVLETEESSWLRSERAARAWRLASRA